MAYTLLKAWLNSSMENTCGSEVVADQVIVTWPELVALWRALMVKAETTRGRASASVLDNRVEANHRQAT